MDDNKSFVSAVALVIAFLSLLVLSSCTKETHRNIAAKEAYVACVEAQKGTPIDLNCGNVKEVK